MSIDENKATVRDFLACFDRGDVEGALSRMTDDCSWWIAGKPDMFALASTKSKMEMTELLGQLVPGMKDGLKMTIKGLTAEGERVAAEVESLGEIEGGPTYNNEYHFLFIVQDGKIAAVKEYLDPMETARFLAALGG